MKVLCLVAVLFCTYTFGFAQSNDIKSKNVQKLYGENAIAHFSDIVDSIHFKLDKSPLSLKYYSLYQGVGQYFHLIGSEADKIQADIEDHLPLHKLLLKYPSIQMEPAQLIVTTLIQNEDKKEVKVFNGCPLRAEPTIHHSIMLDPDNTDQQKSDNWIYEVGKTGNYIHGYYLIKPIEKFNIPASYVKMLHYADNLIDTSQLVMKEEAFIQEDIRPIRHMPNISQFMKYAHHTASTHKHNEISLERLSAQVPRDDPSRYSQNSSSPSFETTFQQYLSQAISEALNENWSSEVFEAYVEQYYDKALALELKRKRFVKPIDSQDRSNIHHAEQIARLAAETRNWNIFLRTHLDLMNGYFPGMISVPLEKEVFCEYVKVLELLNLKVPELLIGTLIEKEASEIDHFHYRSNIQKVAWALSESTNQLEIETLLTKMIGDNSLDPFNRLNMYYVFGMYYQNLAHSGRGSEIQRQFDTALAQLPEYMLDQIDMSVWEEED